MTVKIRRALWILLAIAYAFLIQAPLSAAPCRTSQLELTVGPIEGGMSHVQATLFLANRSQETCTLSGLARVKMLDAQGRLLKLRLGAKARKAKASSRVVPLKPGQKAQFDIEFGSSEPYEPGHCPAPTSKVQVSIGADKAALTAPLNANACTAISVSPFSLAPPQ